MASKKIENTPSGTKIFRYKEPSKPFEAAGPAPDIEEIENHIEKHIGKIETVFHELVSDLVHVDVFYIKPTVERNFITLITGGMSSRPMNTPAGAEDFKYAELMMYLPPNWPLGEKDLNDENYYWPIRQLKMLSRFPHEYDTWIWFGHTIPNGNPPRPFAANTKLSGIMLIPPLSTPKEFLTLNTTTTKKSIFFFNLLPLHSREMNFKLKKGVEPLFDLLDKHGVSEILDVNRPSLVKKKWGLF